MSKLSHLAETLKGSEIVRLGNEIAERIRSGEKVYNYTIGDFNPHIFPIPVKLQKLIISAYEHHHTNYPPANGLAELRKGVHEFLKMGEGLDYEPKDILIASGGRPLIYALFRTVVDPGDKVIYSVPSWNNNHYTNMNQGQHCLIQTTPENNFMPTAAEIEKHIEGAALLCLCSPQNPTGTTLERSELEKICDLVIAENERRGPAQKKLYVMYDQMYWTLTYGNTRHVTPVGINEKMREFTIIIGGISKMFAATGVRVGWAMGPHNVLTKMRSLLSHVGAWAPMAEQKAVAQYLLDTEDMKQYLSQFKTALELRLNRFYEGFERLKTEGFPVDAIAPQAAIYLTVKIDLAGKTYKGKKLENQSDVTGYLLDEAKLALVPFYAFGAPNDSPWYRLSVGTCKLEEIDPVFENLRNALKVLE